MNVRDNSPETEREILRLHASLLNSCADVVKERLATVEQEIAQSASDKAQAGDAVKAEKINVE